MNIFHPNYTIVIDTPAKARLYNRLLVAKIVVSVILLGGLLALGGWTWLQLLCVFAGATIWQGLSIWRRKRKQQ